MGRWLVDDATDVDEADADDIPKESEDDENDLEEMKELKVILYSHIPNVILMSTFSLTKASQ